MTTPTDHAMAAPNPRVGNCPLERMIANALDAANISYRTDYEGAVAAHLDFYLPYHDVYIEVKGAYTNRTREQMSRAPNVVVVQGDLAVRLLAAMIQTSAIFK